MVRLWPWLLLPGVCVVRITLRLLSLTIDTTPPAPVRELDDREVDMGSLVERADPHPIGFRIEPTAPEDRR